MDPLPEDILKILFRIRCGFAADYQRDYDRFFEPLRNWVKTDERVRAVLINRIVETIDGNPRLGEFYGDARMRWDWLFRQLPDSSQLLYLARRYAHDPQGEDGMYTAHCLRLLESHIPDDSWFRRETEQYGGGRRNGFSNSYYLDDPSDDGWTRLEMWADAEPKYRAMVHPDRTYPGALPDEREAYDLPSTTRGPVEGDWSSDSSIERLRWLLSWHGRWCPESRMIRRLVEQVRLNDTPALLELAESHRDVLVELPRVTRQLPGVAEYCRRRLETVRDRGYAGQLSQRASDPELALWALDWLLEHRHDSTTTGEYFVSWNKAFERLVFCDPPMSAAEAIPRVKKVIADSTSPPTWFLTELVRAFPNHPETRRILLGWDAFACLLPVEGLQPDVRARAFAMAENDSAPTSDVLAVLGASRSDEGLRLLLRHAENPSNAPVQYTALQMLAEHYSDREETKGVLQRFAAPEATNTGTQFAARKAMAWAYRGQSWAAELLLIGKLDEVGGLIDFVDDPDYSKWLGKRDAWRSELVRDFNSLDSEYCEKPTAAAHGLALWFGDQLETNELLLAAAAGSLPLSMDGTTNRYRLERIEKSANRRRIVSLKTAVMRWQDDPAVLAAVQSALDQTETELRDEAARLLSRAYSRHPETAARLRRHLAESPIVFGEYIGLRMGDLDAMREGLAVLETLPNTEGARAVALDGPLYLARFFGPRKDMLQELLRIGAARPTWVQEGVVKALERFYRHRNPISQDSSIPLARSKALKNKDGQDWGRVLELALADPDASIRLQAIEALFGRNANDTRSLDALKKLVAEGHAEGLSLFGTKCPDDAAVLDWVLALHRSGAFSSNARGQDLLTACVASHFTGLAAAAAYLLERVRATQSSEEFSVAVQGLCRFYGRDAEVRAFLDSHTMDPRLNGKAADQILTARSAGLHPADKISLFLDTLNDHGSPDVAAKSKAAHNLAAMLCCEGFPKGSAENAIVAEALADALDHHPSPSIRNTLKFILPCILQERGPTKDAGWKEYPRIADALRRLYDPLYRS